MMRFIAGLAVFLALASPASAYNGRGFAGGFIHAAVVEAIERLNIPHGTTPPTAGQSEGDIFWDTDDEELVVWNGSSWVVINGGGSGSYTDEEAQDAVGTILVDTTTVDLTYNDSTPSIIASVIDDSITNAKLANVPTATFKGRTTASTGDPEDLTVSQAKTLLNLTGTNSGDQTITLTGDVTGSGTGSFAATIANDAVTNAKAANMADSTIKGRAASAGTGDPTDLTAGQVATIVNSSLDHGTLGGLGDDDHTQYTILAGRSGGQTLNGGTGSGDTLKIISTSNSTKAPVIVERGAITEPTWSDEDVLVLKGKSSTNGIINVETSDTQRGGMIMSDTSSRLRGYIVYDHASSPEQIAIGTAGVDRVLIDTNGIKSVSGWLELPEISAPGTPSSTGRYYVSTAGLPRFINDGGLDVDLSFSAGAYDPSLYWGGNLVVNFPPIGGQDTLQPEFWEEEDANINVTDEDAIGEGIPDSKHKRVLKVVGGASGTNKYVYQRLVIADHDTLDNGIPISCGVWVYQPDAATATLALVGSVAGSLGTGTSTAVTTWDLIKVENKTVGASDTWVDIRFSVNEASDTSWWSNPMCNVGPVLRPWMENPLRFVYAEATNTVSTDPANTNFSSASFASVSHPLACILQLAGLVTQSGGTSGQSLTIRPPWSTFTGGTDIPLQWARTPDNAGAAAMSQALAHCSDTQTVDWAVTSANINVVRIALHGYWRFTN